MEFRRLDYGRRTNRKFNYKPRYYDEDMEDLHERAERTQKIRDGDNSMESYSERIKHGYRTKQTPEKKEVNQALWISRLRFILIASILGMLLYLFFYTDVINTIFEAFSNA